MPCPTNPPSPPAIPGTRPPPGRGPNIRRSTAIVSADVVIVGGGFTGLSAAAHLAKAGTNVALIEAHRFGDGASGRNGGQLGTGQRAWAEELEAELGFARAKALFDLAEEAKAHLLEFAAANGIEIDLHAGPDVGGAQEALRRRLQGACRDHGDPLRLSAHQLTWTRAETAERLGSTHYFGGIRDTGTGHIHPLKLVIGTARVAAAAGAKLFENTQCHRHLIRAAARCA